tara:strand:+ start:337 stop:531 length:195 start_codon:yes stop_codon:yes gene_type:complete
MKLIYFFKYLYLVFAALFFLDAIKSWNLDSTRVSISLFFAFFSVFIFFFRDRYQKKFKNRDKSD